MTERSELRFGLPAGCFSDLVEPDEFTTVDDEFHGIYTSHIRRERDTLVNSIKETKRRGKTVAARLKAVGKTNWGRSLHALRLNNERDGEGSMSQIVKANSYGEWASRLRGMPHDDQVSRLVDDSLYK